MKTSTKELFAREILNATAEVLDAKVSRAALNRLAKKLAESDLMEQVEQMMIDAAHDQINEII